MAIGSRIGMGIGDASIGLGRGILSGFQTSLVDQGVAESIQDVFAPLTGGFVRNSPSSGQRGGTSRDRRASAYYDDTEVRRVSSIVSGGQTVNVPGGYLSREAIRVYEQSGVRVNYA